MYDPLLPESVGSKGQLPRSLGASRDDLCKRLDALHARYQLEAKPSDMFRGAIFVSDLDRRNNLDWIAQAANSLREIIYPLWSDGVRTVPEKKEEVLRSNGSARTSSRIIDEVDRVYGLLNDLTHHGCDPRNLDKIGKKFATFNAKDFEELLHDFEVVMREALILQTDIHEAIDRILAGDPNDIHDPDLFSPATIANAPSSNRNGQRFLDLIDSNPDSRDYLFAKADERWLDWISSNGLLDKIKQTPVDASSPWCAMPELGYLLRMTEQEPKKVIDIVLSVPSSHDAFNPQVIDGFLTICSKLPAAVLSEIATKIQSEHWVILMEKFNRWGVEYGKILNTLSNAKDWKSLLVISKEILSIRKKLDIKSLREPFFYFDGLMLTNVFECLAKVDSDHVETAFSLTIEVISGIALLGEANNKKDTFQFRETFPLSWVDIFTLQPGKRGDSTTDDIAELMALIKKLATQMIGSTCSEENEVRRIYDTYIATLPDSSLLYRLKLFFLSLCPTALRRDIKSTLYRIFEIQEVHQLTMGAEYKQLIKSSFHALCEEERQDYVSRVIASSSTAELSKCDGIEILSSAYSYLSEDQKSQVETALGPLLVNYKPTPAVSQVAGGLVSPKSPGKDSDWLEPITVIAQKLKNEWSPRRLKEEYIDDDLLRPKNAEGVGDRLKIEMEKRLMEYVNDALLFFDRSNLHPHYTYNYFRGISELLRNNKITKGVDLSEIIKLMETIAQSGIDNPFVDPDDTNGRSDWLACWTDVHNGIADVLKYLIAVENGRALIDFGALRDRIFRLITYLFRYPDPTSKDEQPEIPTARGRPTRECDYQGKDPYVTAVNSVRGKTFEALVLFVFHDNIHSKISEDKISNDVKSLYEEVLMQEATQAVMFMFGRHIPTFYYRDKNWLVGLLGSIFAVDSNKKDLYIAAWEGYLSNNLFKEVFFDQAFQKLYQRAIDLPPNHLTKRKFFQNINEGLGDHLALAYVHFDEFNLESVLFKSFWAAHRDKCQGEFIRFVGKRYISRLDPGRDMSSTRSTTTRLKLISLWDWLIAEYNEVKVLQDLGSWMSLDGKVFELPWLSEQIKRTLEKTGGVINWDSGLTSALPELARATPETALEIARLFILEGKIRHKCDQMRVFLQDEWLSALSIVYNNPRTKIEASTLISVLVREGERPFWPLENIIRENSGAQTK